MQSIANPVTIAVIIGLMVWLTLYILFVKTTVRRRTLTIGEGGDKQLSPFLRFTELFGNELYNALPASMAKPPRKQEKIESLLRRSGNPWGLKAEEFPFFQVVTGVMGLIFGTLMWFFLSFTLPLPWYVVAPAFAVLGYFIPQLEYSDKAKKRDQQFRSQLPNALYLIIMSLQGRAPLDKAIRSAIPNMRDGILKDEFLNVLHYMDSGKTLNEALEAFGQRAPNESIRMFVEAVKQANRLDISAVETLKARAAASREEHFALINDKTTQLSSKMMMVLSATMLPAFLLVILAPNIPVLRTVLGF